MNVYLDDDSAKRSLAAMLRQAGHHVVVPLDGQHPGIIVVRLDNDPNRDMKDRDVVRALGKLERSGVPIANELHILNHWR